MAVYFSKIQKKNPSLTKLLTEKKIIMMMTMMMYMDPYILQKKKKEIEKRRKIKNIDYLFIYGVYFFGNVRMIQEK